LAKGEIDQQSTDEKKVNVEDGSNVYLDGGMKGDQADGQAFDGA